MLTSTHIDIGKDFSSHLGVRYRHEGEYSGEEFRVDILEPAFRKYDKIIIKLDSIEGYTSSFLEEAFGGLVRDHDLASVSKKLAFNTLDRGYLVKKIEGFMKDAEANPKRK